jgi:hypothetical protein
MTSSEAYVSRTKRRPSSLNWRPRNAELAFLVTNFFRTVQKLRKKSVLYLFTNKINKITNGKIFYDGR